MDTTSSIRITGMNSSLITADRSSDIIASSQFCYHDINNLIILRVINAMTIVRLIECTTSRRMYFNLD